MKHIWGLFIVGLAVLAITEAKRHHSRRTTSTTTEGSTTVESSTNATTSMFQDSTLSLVISTVPTNASEAKNKTSGKGSSHGSTTAAPSSATSKSVKTTASPSNGTTHSGNTTSSISTTTPKPGKVTKRPSKSWRRKSKSKSTPSTSTTPKPTAASSTTNSTNSTKASGKSSTPTTNHHATTTAPPKTASANATNSANTSTTVVPLVTTNNTESTKHAHESSKSPHKTTKSSVASTTPQPSSASKHASKNTTATTVAKTTTAKSNHSMHATTASPKTTSPVNSTTAHSNVTTHPANHTATTKPSAGSTSPKPTTIKPSKVTKPSKVPMETTIPKPVTVRPTASMNVTSRSNSTTIHANATTPHPNVTTKHVTTPKSALHHATTPAHLPTGTTIKSANNTVGKPTTNSTAKTSSLTTTTPHPSVLKGTTKKPSFLETLKHLTHLGSHGTTKHPPASNSTDKSNQTLPGTKATTVPISTTAYTMPKFSYVVNDRKTGVPCILSKMSISMSISYEKSDNAIADGTMVVPNNALTDGTCTEETTEMKLMWSAPRRRKRDSGHNGLNTVILNFVKNGKVSSLDSMIFEFFLDPVHFPGAVEKVLKRNTTKGLGLFASTPNTGHYICEDEISISASNVKITIADVSLIAFNKDKNLNSKKVEKCTHKVSFKKIAVIGGAVGIVLLVTALGACIWRSKTRRDNSTLP
ncbi:mucin-5AC-like isoform X3 [Venturia canescens]|uniref:mucin-5AC-like isoform X3 n=1 Tax=Venturia canescens TaxID=32260 RepID=UPI001C9CE13B|nr:mucin-5AC-like isoform X3 [Venturia canescens]